MVASLLREMLHVVERYLLVAVGADLHLFGLAEANNDGRKRGVSLVRAELALADELMFDLLEGGADRLLHSPQIGVLRNAVVPRRMP